MEKSYKKIEQKKKEQVMEKIKKASDSDKKRIISYLESLLKDQYSR